MDLNAPAAAQRAPPEHPTRAKLLLWIEERPGACIQDMADFLEVARTAAVHHVRVLVKDGYVRVVKSGRRALHYSTRVGAKPGDDLLAHLRLERARLIVDALREDPGTSWRSLAKRLDVTPRAVRWHVQRLEQEGLIQVVPKDRGARHVVVLNPALRHLASEGLDEPVYQQPRQAVGAEA
ncbi:MAG: winged helix-turn-helix transcriptional regulator [Thermoplasmatota archaeon]